MDLTLSNLRDLVKTNKTFNPFSTSFDKTSLKKTLSSYKQHDKKSAAFIEFIFLAHEIYTCLVSNINKEFNAIGLPVEDLHFMLFQVTNRQSVRTNTWVLDELAENRISLDTESNFFLNLQNPDGRTIHAATAMELHVDIL